MAITLCIGREEKEAVPVQTGRLLDDLFRKTKAVPCVYWMPLSEEQVSCHQHSSKDYTLTPTTHFLIDQRKRGATTEKHCGTQSSLGGNE
jgi:hypothetical protein